MPLRRSGCRRRRKGGTAVVEEKVLSVAQVKRISISDSPIPWLLPLVSLLIGIAIRQQFERGHREYQLQRDLDELDGRLEQLADEREELWRHYRHSDDPHERHELRHRLERLQWHEMELRHDYLQLHQQQLLLDGKPEH